MPDDLDRRRLLSYLGALGLTAGCGAWNGDGAPPTTGAPSTTTTSTPVDTSTATTAPPTSTTATKTTSTPTDTPTTTEQPSLSDAAAPPGDMAAVRERLAATDEVVVERNAAGPFEGTWASLADYSPPEWLRDRKFGIYFHWGLYSVPAYKYEWYPKWMYTPFREGWGSDVYDHHVATYGEPDVFPYQDFAPMFTAESFDAGEWAALFADANAGFAGPVAEHHDGWSNWQSGINPYNAAAMGPERDLVGELESAIRDEGMKFVTTFHHGRAARPDRRREADENYLDSYFGGAYTNYPSVTEGFPNRIMYRNVSEEVRWGMWLGKLVEVLERYEPDMVWHDSLHVPPEDIRRRYLAYNLNRAVAQDRDVAITYKEVDYLDVVGSDTLTRDYENEVAGSIQPSPWLADVNVANGAWCYTTQQGYRTVGDLVRTLVEIVAKNGQMLLNLTPKADGTFPAAVRDRLTGIGDWLDVNGEAIFETRPWHTWEDGDAVRYTRSKDSSTLYAIAVGYPDGELRLPSVPTDPASDASVQLLGHGNVGHRVDGGDVVIDVPSLSFAERPSNHAVSFVLSGFTG